MTSEQLDRFQEWLKREAEEADKAVEANYNLKRAYNEGRRCAFNDAFECLAILRMNAENPK